MKLLSLFDNLYGITEDGKLFSTRSNRYLKPATDKHGYKYYVISIDGNRKTLKAHRLVAMAFIPNPQNKPTVDHINGDRMDNRVENLRWATLKEQQVNPVTLHRLEEVHNRTDYRQMGALRNFGRRQTSAYKDGECLGTFQSLKEAADFVGVSYGKASECANGKKKSVKGVVFCYE